MHIEGHWPRIVVAFSHGPELPRPVAPCAKDSPLRCVENNKICPLAEAAVALRYLVEGRPFGRVVLTI